MYNDLARSLLDGAEAMAKRYLYGPPTLQHKAAAMGGCAVLSQVAFHAIISSRLLPAPVHPYDRRAKVEAGAVYFHQELDAIAYRDWARDHAGCYRASIINVVDGERTWVAVVGTVYDWLGICRRPFAQPERQPA